MAGNRWQIRHTSRVREWTQQGRSAAWIARELGCSVQTVRRLRRRAGVSESVQQERARARTAEARAQRAQAATEAARQEMQALDAQLDAARAELRTVRQQLQQARQQQADAEARAELASARAPRGSGYALAPASVLPWVLWVTYSDAELVRICTEHVLPSEWYGDLPIPPSAADTIRRAWGEAHSSRWQAHRRSAERDGVRAQIKAQLSHLSGRALTEAAADLFDTEVERRISADPWPHTAESWRK